MSTRISRHAALQPLLALLAALAPAAAAHAPHDVVTEAAISPTFAQDHTLLAAFTFTDHLLVGRSVDGGASWQKYGLPMLAHDVTGFAFSPQFAQDGIAFAATGGGGVWRTKNAGLDWKPALGGLPSLTVLGVAVSPDFATDGVVLAATEGGCARSTDGGRSWTTITAGLAETTLHVVVFAPDSADDVIIAGKVVQTSSDRGLTWTSHAAFPDPVETLAVSRHYGADGTAMLAFGRFGNGTRLTTNGCLSFAASDAGLSDAFVIELAVADDGTTFAATKTAGCFRAAAPGAPWELAINGFEELSDQTSNHNTEALVSPDFGRDRTAFIGAFEGLYITTDGGDSWRECNIYSQMLNRHVFFSPDYAHDRTIFCGNYGGGVYEYTDLPAPGAPGGPGSPAGSLAPPSGGAPVLGPPAGGLPGTDRGSAQIDAHDPLPQVPRWHGRSNNIAALFSDALALSPAFASDRTMFYGYTVLCRSKDAGLHWTPLVKPANVTVTRRIATSPAYASDHTVIFGSGGQGVYRSLNGGDSFTQLELPPAFDTSSIDFSPGFAADRTVFMSSRNLGVYRSTDGGTAWLPVNAGLLNLEVRSFVVSPDFVADRTAFAGTVGDGVFVTKNAGASWAPSNAGLPGTAPPAGGPLIIENIICSPAFGSDHTVFASALNDSMFRSVDGGLTWTPAGAGLPKDALRTFDVSPAFAQDRTLAAGTYGWVWITRDAGASWSRLPGGMRVDEGHPTVFHGGLWAKNGSVNNNGAFVLSSVTAGDWEEFTFFGDRIVWYANTGTTSGIAAVSLDGETPASVDLYRPTPAVQEPVFERRYAQPGWHVIRVLSTGTANPASLLPVVSTDGFFYEF